MKGAAAAAAWEQQQQQQQQHGAIEMGIGCFQPSTNPSFRGQNPMTNAAVVAESNPLAQARKTPLNRQPTFSRDKPAPPPEMSISHFSPLPPGWHEATDPNSGNRYYYTDFGETSWIRPTVSIV